MKKLKPANVVWIYLYAITISFAGLSNAAEYPCQFETDGYPAAFKREVMQYSPLTSPDGIVLVLEGPIESKESQRLELELRKTMAFGKISEVWFNSPGGVATEGMKMGHVLRRYGIPTRIPKGNVCFSACSYAFLGGLFRTVEVGGKYGVHMFTGADYRKKEILKGVNQDLKTKTTESWNNTENVVKTIEQGSAELAGLFMSYLSEMGISAKVGTHNFNTENNSGSCPPVSVLKNWNVDNSP